MTGKDIDKMQFEEENEVKKLSKKDKRKMKQLHLMVQYEHRNSPHNYWKRFTDRDLDEFLQNVVSRLSHRAIEGSFEAIEGPFMYGNSHTQSNDEKDKARKKSYYARHNAQDANPDKFSARYWSHKVKW